MKNLLKISLMIIMLLCISINMSYAAIEFDLSLNASKSTDLRKDDIVTVSVKISNVKSDIGLVTFGATLDYPEKSLQLVDIQGNGNYPKPGYNASTKKLLIERTPSKDEGTMFTIKFKVKNADSKNLTVTLNNITSSDGSGLAKMNSKSISLKVKEQSKPSGTSTPSKPGNSGTTTQKPGSSTTTKPSGSSSSGSSTSNKKPNGNSNSGNSASSKKPSSTSNSGSSTSTKKPSVSNKKDSTVKDSNLPHTGVVEKVLPISLLAILTVSIILFIKMKQIDKK